MVVRGEELHLLITIICLLIVIAGRIDEWRTGEGSRTGYRCLYGIY